MTEESIRSCTCSRCHYIWYLRSPQIPRVCPKCKSPYWSSDSEFKQDFEKDKMEAKKIEEILSNEMDEIRKNPLHWEKIIKVGFERMFKTSEFPIQNIERVLNGGFSVNEWFVEVSKNSSALIDDVVTKCLNIKSKKTAGDTDRNVEKIKEILEWNKVLGKMNDETIKILSFLWFADNLSSEIKYDEEENSIHKSALSILEKYIEIRESEMIQNVENMIDSFDNEKKSAVGWHEVIRLP